MPYLYNFVYGLLLLATLPYWLYKAATTGKYRQGLWQKLCGSPPLLKQPGEVAWIHAVSVGEVALLKPLLARLTADRPDLRLALSTSTNTGFALAKDRYPLVPVFYAPFDFTWAVKRTLDRWKPSLIVLVELELWPNLLLEAKRRKIPVAVVNARITERSFRGYWRIRWLLRPALDAVRWWGAQTDAYADRIRMLAGTDIGTVATTGSLKIDGAVAERDNPRTQELRRLFGMTNGERVLVAGSTQHPEEEVVLDAFLRLSENEPSLRLILVPRAPERFSQVAELLRARNVEHVRRSELGTSRTKSAKVTLVDTIGELAYVWGLAEFGYVGGSLECERGGQSMIEPAGYGVPVCFGPNVWNFQAIADQLLAQNAAVQIQDRSELLPLFERWLRDPDEARSIGLRARAFILAHQGATRSTVRALESLLPVPDALRKTA